jgi:hypothetical protein
LCGNVGWEDGEECRNRYFLEYLGKTSLLSHTKHRRLMRFRLLHYAPEFSMM